MLESRFNKLQIISVRVAVLSNVQANSNCKVALELIVRVAEFRHALQLCILFNGHFPGSMV